jgi:hypothetical protein
MWPKIVNQYRRWNSMQERIIRMQEALGRIEARQVVGAGAAEQAEFRVFSQWGEDGIIQYLVRRVPIERRVFVEFGVENYLESNTRFLLTNNQWSGLVMDGSQENIDYVRRDPIYWATNLKAERAFVTRENINELLLRSGVSGDIGLLSVDIDGNDYWVWEAVEVVAPRIVVCEYNSQFGPAAEVSTPYDAEFVRSKAHFSRIYYGASISALTTLAKRKGYSLVAANSAGNNVFFVRDDLLGSLKILLPIEAYRRAQFREYHDERGNLTFDDFETRLAKIGDLPVFDFTQGRVVSIRAMVAAGAI